MLDSPEGVCAGQAGLEYPATSVLFSIATAASTSAPAHSLQAKTKCKANERQAPACRDALLGR